MKLTKTMRASESVAGGHVVASSCDNVGLNQGGSNGQEDIQW